jgi:hypothetical protein
MIKVFLELGSHSTWMGLFPFLSTNIPLWCQYTQISWHNNGAYLVVLAGPGCNIADDFFLLRGVRECLDPESVPLVNVVATEESPPSM